ncbi:MAG: DUF2237 domain-containing protein [Pseudomonadota bacterium]
MMPDDNLQLNILGGPLEICGCQPLTGFARDGHCADFPGDVGGHLVCAEVTAEFLRFTARRGNDLSTPRPEFAFPGLRPGDHWCLCASRWLEAYEAGAAPSVRLEATHGRALEIIPKSVLIDHAALAVKESV